MYIRLLLKFLSAGNVASMLGPKKVPLDLQEVAGTILITALVFGLGVGSLLGPYLVYLL
jgi:hypothetical protein